MNCFEDYYKKKNCYYVCSQPIVKIKTIPGRHLFIIIQQFIGPVTKRSDIYDTRVVEKDSG